MRIGHGDAAADHLYLDMPSGAFEQAGRYRSPSLSNRVTSFGQQGRIAAAIEQAGRVDLSNGRDNLDRQAALLLEWVLSEMNLSITALLRAYQRSSGYEDGIAALLRSAEMSASDLVRAVRAGALSPTYADSHNAKAHLLNATKWAMLNPSPNFLDEKPDCWACFTEPQITGGWMHHLNRRSRLARGQAMFDAAWAFKGRTPPKLVRIELAAAELGRVDMLVIGEDAQGVRHCVCIEAKFGHMLTEQLSPYEAYVSRSHDMHDPACRAMLIVAPEARSDIAFQLARPDNQWHFCTWKRWLIAYDNALPQVADDADFRRFRRTTLHRATQELDI